MANKLTNVKAGEWTPEHDLLLFKRLSRMLAAVPDEAMPRVRAYAMELLKQDRPERSLFAIKEGR